MAAICISVCGSKWWTGRKKKRSFQKLAQNSAKVDDDTSGADGEEEWEVYGFQSLGGFNLTKKK